MDSIRWTTIATYTSPPEAHVARLFLESNDIDCFLADENIVATAWHYTVATGGIKLQVDAPEVDRAAALLRTRADVDDTAPVHLDDNDHCPRCNSDRITRDGFTTRRIVGLVFLTAIGCSGHWILGGLLLSACVVAIVRSSGYRCDECGHAWDHRRGFAIVPTAKLAPPHGQPD